LLKPKKRRKPVKSSLKNIAKTPLAALALSLLWPGWHRRERSMR
jgi:hypothetical protein